MTMIRQESRPDVELHFSAVGSRRSRTRILTGLLLGFLQDTLANPTVRHFLDTRLAQTDFSTKDILGFLNHRVEEDGESGAARFTWRSVFHLLDQVINMFNQYGEVSSALICRPESKHHPDPGPAPPR